MTRVTRTGTLLVGAVLVLTGCSSTVAGTASPASMVAVPPGDDPLFEALAVGTCHDLETGYLPLEVPEVVDCDDPHTAETAVVVDTGLPLDAAYPTEGDLEEGYLGDAFDDVCGFDVPQEYLGDDDVLGVYADYAQVLPSQEQWAGGPVGWRATCTTGTSSPRSHRAGWPAPCRDPTGTPT